MPQIIKFSFSVRQFTKDNNVSVEFDPNGFYVKDLRSGTTIMRNNSRGDLYPVSSSSSAHPSHSAHIVQSSHDFWHDRLGNQSKVIFFLLPPSSWTAGSHVRRFPTIFFFKHRRLPAISLGNGRRYRFRSPLQRRDCLQHLFEQLTPQTSPPGLHCEQYSTQGASSRQHKGHLFLMGQMVETSSSWL